MITEEEIRTRLIGAKDKNVFSEQEIHFMSRKTENEWDDKQLAFQVRDLIYPKENGQQGTEEEVDFVDEVSSKLAGLPLGKRHMLFALWMSKEREEGSKTLELLLALDGIHSHIYSKHKGKEGFTAAALRANIYILSLVYGR